MVRPSDRHLNPNGMQQALIICGRSEQRIACETRCDDVRVSQVHLTTAGGKDSLVTKKTGRQ